MIYLWCESIPVLRCGSRQGYQAMSFGVHRSPKIAMDVPIAGMRWRDGGLGRGQGGIEVFGVWIGIVDEDDYLPTRCQ
jgi:hypothetical protein